jgi:hypothetical protein
VITVNGHESDYAIMKQVQQLELLHHQMPIVTLDDTTDFSALAAGETLYMVSHGNISNGNFADIKRPELLSWLTDQSRGVPPNFGGIVILSCYSGLEVKAGQGSLAAYLAGGLKGRAATGTPVAGANGYSFGTPEFRRSGRSSVLSMDLAAFYYASSDVEMIKAWLNHKPTHTDGVLKDMLTVKVDTGKTIEEQLATVQKAPTKTPEAIAHAYVTAFANEAKAIESRLENIINSIPGDSVAARADYLVDQANAQKPDVVSWNQAIDKQDTLFHDLYLWAPVVNAFTKVNVP